MCPRTEWKEVVGVEAIVAAQAHAGLLPPALRTDVAPPGVGAAVQLKFAFIG